MNMTQVRPYTSRRVPVLPCRETGARPKSPYIAGGFHQASFEEGDVLDWFRRFPTAIYGIACAPNGFIVVDADRHGNGDGVANLLAICSQHRFDPRDVPLVKTPGNGLHLFFLKPRSVDRTRSRLAEAVDLRDNGYVIAPGMTLPDGRRYELVNGTIEGLASSIASRSLPPMPGWLSELARIPSAHSATDKPATKSMSNMVPANQIAGVVRVLAGAQLGNRNRMLFWAACRFGEMVQQGVITRQSALEILAAAGAQIGLNAHEAQLTAGSGLRRGEGSAPSGR